MIYQAEVNILHRARTNYLVNIWTVSPSFVLHVAIAILITEEAYPLPQHRNSAVIVVPCGEKVKPSRLTSQAQLSHL